MKKLEPPDREPEDIDEYIEYVPPDEKKPLGIDIIMRMVFILAILMAAFALIMNLGDEEVAGEARNRSQLRNFRKPILTAQFR